MLSKTTTLSRINGWVLQREEKKNYLWPSHTLNLIFRALYIKIDHSLDILCERKLHFSYVKNLKVMVFLKFSSDLSFELPFAKIAIYTLGVPSERLLVNVVVN